MTRTHLPCASKSCRELFATLAQFFMGDSTPAARRKMEQLRLTERTGPLLMVDDATTTDDLLADGVAVPTADDAIERGVYPPAHAVFEAMARGDYGLSKIAMPSASILGSSNMPSSSYSGKYILDPALTAVKDKAEWSDRERVLAVTDSLLDQLLQLEAAVKDLDDGTLVLGDAVPAPPGSGMTGMVVPVAKVNAHLRRRGNEKLQQQWTQIQRAVAAARREREQLKQLLNAAWGDKP